MTKERDSVNWRSDPKGQTNGHPSMCLAVVHTRHKSERKTLDACKKMTRLLLLLLLFIPAACFFFLLHADGYCFVLLADEHQSNLPFFVGGEREREIFDAISRRR